MMRALTTCKLSVFFVEDDDRRSTIDDELKVPRIFFRGFSGSRRRCKDFRAIPEEHIQQRFPYYSRRKSTVTVYHTVPFFFSKGVDRRRDRPIFLKRMRSIPPACAFPVAWRLGTTCFLQQWWSLPSILATTVQSILATTIPSVIPSPVCANLPLYFCTAVPQYCTVYSIPPQYL